jgi:serine phosphatase RsbU (regulator of sigma subunit)
MKNYGIIGNWFGALKGIDDRRVGGQANNHAMDTLMKGYLLKAFPMVKGLKFDAIYKAANVVEKLGGDWYDTFE